MESSPSSIFMSAEQKERRYLADLGIRFHVPLSMDAWPKHLLNTFQHMNAITSYDVPTFTSNALAKQKLGITWDCETVNRAKTIATTCRALAEEEVESEMEWRLRIEELFLARFRSEINCRSCKGRLWRSEIEAIVESPGIIAANLEERRKSRHPCQCQNQMESSNLSGININKIFSSRADELVLYDPFKKAPKKSTKTNPRKRRPDRIVGFQETRSLERRLDSIAQWLPNAGVTKTIRETTECTVLNSKGGQLLFPFLVIEAKSENGFGFGVCRRQTALPIWKMLRIQKELQSQSKRNLEYGGPLVWYIAYRGKEWRLYACYTVEEDGKVYYEILELWTRQLSDDKEALQALLMIDYIVDWARDIYRASIFKQLEDLAKKPSAELENRKPRVPTDSDIHSLSGSRHKLSLDIENWITNTTDVTASPQVMCATSSLCGSSSNINSFNPEIVHEKLSVPFSNDLKPATPNSSEELGQVEVQIGPGQELVNEYNLDRADSPSTESLDSDMGEDEAAELRAAIADPVLTLYQKLAAQDPFIAPPAIGVTAAESPSSEDSANAKLSSNPPITQSLPSSHDSNPKTPRSHQQPLQPTPTINIHNASPSLHPPSLNNKTNKKLPVPLSTTALSPHTPPQTSPSLVPNCTPPLTPTRASAPPTPEHSISVAGSSPKRPLDLEDDNMVEISGAGTGTGLWNGSRAKRVKSAFAGAPPGVDVVVID